MNEIVNVFVYTEIDKHFIESELIITVLKRDETNKENQKWCKKGKIT